MPNSTSFRALAAALLVSGAGCGNIGKLFADSVDNPHIYDGDIGADKLNAALSKAGVTFVAYQGDPSQDVKDPHGAVTYQDCDKIAADLNTAQDKNVRTFIADHPDSAARLFREDGLALSYRLDERHFAHTALVIDNRDWDSVRSAHCHYQDKFGKRQILDVVANADALGKVLNADFKGADALLNGTPAAAVAPADCLILKTGQVATTPTLTMSK